MVNTLKLYVWENWEWLQELVIIPHGRSKFTGHQCRLRKALIAGVRIIMMNEMLHPFPERQVNQHMHQLHVRHSSLITRDLSIYCSKFHKITCTDIHKSIDQSLRWINPCFILSTCFSKLLLILSLNTASHKNIVSTVTTLRTGWSGVWNCNMGKKCNPSQNAKNQFQGPSR